MGLYQRVAARNVGHGTMTEDANQGAAPTAGRKKTTRRKLMQWLITILVIALVWVAIGCALQRRFLFPRYMVSRYTPSAQSLPGLVKLWIDTDAGRVEGWLLPGDGVDADHPGPAVIFAHGNAESIDLAAEGLLPYCPRGISVLLPEYRGYVRSAGSPSQAAITSDYTAFYDLLADRPEVDRDRIFLHGRSVGGGVVCALGAKRRPAALILQSPFTSVRNMAKRMLFPPFLIFDPFDNAKVLAAYDGPVLIQHGRYDDVVPHSHGQALHDIAPNSQLLLYDCGHNDFPIDTDAYWQDVQSFLAANHIINPSIGFP